MKNNQNNYRTKYLELRTKYINDLDMAFRLGVEQGMQQAQQQQALEAQAQTQEMETRQVEAEAMGNGEEQPGGPPGESSGEQPGERQSTDDGASAPVQTGASEMDQHIGKLESMLGGSSETPEEVKKSLQALVSLRKKEKFDFEMKKSEQAISGIAKALHKPKFKIGVQAKHNLNSNAKQAVTMQHKIVNDIMKAWQSEENKASKDITNILNIESLIKE